MHVLFFSDYHGCGGHELMTAEAARAVARHERVSFMVYGGNARLLERLAAPVEIHRHDYRSSRLQELRSAVSLRAQRRLAARMRRLRPDVVVIAQGRIELGSIGLIAARMAGVRAISYLPLAHSLTVAGTRLGASLRDRVDRLYYGLADRFITVSERMKALIARHGGRAPIAIVPNGLDASRHRTQPRAHARRQLGLPAHAFVATLAGRLDMRQKGHDIAIEALARHRALRDVHLVFVGDGPDRDKLARLARKAGVAVSFLPWTDDVAAVYSASDIAILPSRYEGFPIVLLEAMLHRLPIVASNVDAMAELLPPAWLCEPAQPDAFAETLTSVRRGVDASLLEAHRALVLREYTLERFGERFHDAVTSA